MISDDQLSQEAIKYIKQKEKDLCKQYADPEKYPALTNPSTYFMAGSPGAGKTEYSKSFIKILEDKEPKRKIVRIDADEIRDFLPQYDHKNAKVVQSAAFIGVEKLYDHALRHKQDCLI